MPRPFYGSLDTRAALEAGQLRQLPLLRRGGILTSRREGKIVLYRADRAGVLDVLDDLRAYLLTCC
ncbi:hypothetical protein [Plantactinospora sp. CA-290183]|uniref:hypothetical protein n=1 Tax=Plantactinospora sp. CA-290183 TaxID=3240006 RepID=UPI003D8A5A52